jgi:hypothetical protein
MPRRHDNAVSSPIDLSVASGDAEKRAGNLSVVRPEILFGDGGKFLQNHDLLPTPALPFGPSLAALAAVASAGKRESAAQSMKEAFQEVLMSCGVPRELAEAIAQNANNCTPGRIRISMLHPV